MSSLLRRLTGINAGKSKDYKHPIPYQDQKDIEHAAASASPSAHLNGSSTFQLNPKLVKFQNLVGIQSTRTEIPGRPAPNPGIYKRTVDEEAKARYGYIVSTYIINSFFLLQIIVGAALTALGAANGPSAVVTILGAVNTIVAGVLTYLKGQGLPARLKQDMDLLRILREHIEERERELTEADSTLDVDEVVQSIVQMYKEVRQTAADNAPGNVLAPKGAIASLIKKTDAGNQVPTPEGMGGKSLGDKLREAQTVVKEAAPAMKHGLEDIRTIKMKAEQEVEAQEHKLQTMISESEKDKDHIESTISD
ncbi:MAG: hypothetical protein Q9191_007352 [Dirinaria sp. TL-2023a]